MTNPLNDIAKHGGLRVTIDGATGSGKVILEQAIFNLVDACPALVVQVEGTTAMTSRILTISRISPLIALKTRIPMLSDLELLRATIVESGGLDLLITVDGKNVIQVYADVIPDADDPIYTFSTGSSDYKLYDIKGWCVLPSAHIDP